MLFKISTHKVSKIVEEFQNGTDSRRGDTDTPIIYIPGCPESNIFEHPKQCLLLVPVNNQTAKFNNVLLH